MLKQCKRNDEKRKKRKGKEKTSLMIEKKQKEQGEEDITKQQGTIRMSKAELNDVQMGWDLTQRLTFHLH